MTFEEIKAGLEKYCSGFEERLKNSAEQECEEEKLAYVLELIRKQSPRAPQNIVYDENYGCYLGRCYNCGQVMTLTRGTNYCQFCGNAVLWGE